MDLDFSYIQKDQLKNTCSFIWSRYKRYLGKKERKLIEIWCKKIRKRDLEESYILYTLLSGFVFFNIKIETKKLLPEEQKTFEKIKILFHLEKNWLYKDFLQLLHTVTPEIFLIFSYHKYIIFVYQEFDEILEKQPHQILAKMLGYIYIPLLCYRWFNKIERTLQDVYFRYIYPDLYTTLIDNYSRASHQINWLISMNVINEINKIMYDVNIFWISKARLKSYFSVYNKMIRKKHNKIYDYTGIRIMFSSKKDIKKFCKEFEKKIEYLHKKDYIKDPKKNGYQSIHYRFFYIHKGMESFIELQLRTRKMDEKINKNMKTSSFNYSLQQKKYCETFVEIHNWLTYILDIFRKQKTKKFFQDK